MKRIFLTLTFVGLLFVTFASAQNDETRTAINDKTAAKQLLGKHKLSLQWISWDYFGSATVSDKKCAAGKARCYRLVGQQKGKGNSDHLKIDGMVLSIENKQFTFRGAIKTQVSHINGGKECVRSGDFTFRITGKRKYWRLMEMDNTCDAVTDYVDIYFR